MTPTVFILILNPVTSAIFAAALFVLWQHQKHLKYIRLLGLAFALKSCAYLMQFVTMTDHVTFARIVSNSLYMATASLLVGGLIARYHARPPYGAMIVVSVVTIAVLCFYQIAVPDDGVRVLAVNGGIGVISAIGAWMLYRLSHGTFIERMQILLLVLHVFGAILRPVILFASDPTLALSIDSAYWLGVTGSDLVVSMLLVLCIVTGVALDVFARLRTESIQDPLSGLLNRRGFEEIAAGRLALAAAKAEPAVLVLADLDHFKTINDTHGHGVGDAVIATFARVLADAAGTHAVSGRIGGEEFAVLLSGADAAEGSRFAERVRLAFMLTPIPALPAPRTVTASFGIAASVPGEPLETVIRRADQFLYRAKNEGRDCIRVAAGSGPQVVSIATRALVT